MASKEQTQRGDKAGSKPALAKPTPENLDVLARQQIHPATLIQRARLDPRSLTPAHILHLQRTLGNQAVGQLLSGAKPRPVIQARLTVGPAHDAYEQEADRVAAQVMVAPAPPAPIAQRVGEEEELPAKPLASATPGQDIYFGAGRDQPESDSGKHLLAHEVAHVGQQDDAGGVIHRKIEPGKLNLVGEDHEDSKGRRGAEKAMVQEKYGFSAGQYWEENTFQYKAFGVTRGGDSLVHLVLQSAAFLLENFEFMKRRILKTETIVKATDQAKATVDAAIAGLIQEVEDALEESRELQLAADELESSNEYLDVVDQALAIAEHIDISLNYYIGELEENHAGTLPLLLKSVEAIEKHIQQILEGYDVATTGPKQVATQIVHERSLGMYMAAEEAAEKNGKTGVWKVGDTHANDLKDGVQNFNSDRLTVTSRTEFDAELEAWQQKQVQREATPKEEKVQSKALVQRSGGGFEAGAEFEAQLDAARGGGTPLPKDTRDFMEQRMGADFSGVRVHTDAQSDQLNQSIQAKAFTTGQDVFFRQGEYEPGSRGGQELIAHELTHVVQQIGKDRIQRSLLDKDDNTFENSIEATLGQNKDTTAEDLISALFSCQTVLGPDGAALSRDDVLGYLLSVQQLLEKWKYEEPDNQNKCEEIWKQLNLEIKEKIEEITAAGITPNGAYTGETLAKAKEAELQSLAMRTLVANVATYRETGTTEKQDIPTERLKRHGRGATPISSFGVHEGTYALVAKQVEKEGVAACTHFAFAAAKMLEGHGVRVDVVSGKGLSSGTGHTYVLLGRDGDNMWDINTWGDGCVLIDCWAGALNWENFEANPQVIYPKDEWAERYPVIEHVSDSNQGYAASSEEGQKTAVVKEPKRPGKATIPEWRKQVLEEQRKKAPETRLESAKESEKRAMERQEREGKVEQVESEESEKWRTVESWQEAEKMQWAYFEMFQMGKELYLSKTKWPREYSEGENSDKKAFKDWVEKVGEV